MQVYFEVTEPGKMWVYISTLRLVKRHRPTATLQLHAAKYIIEKTNCKIIHTTKNIS